MYRHWSLQTLTLKKNRISDKLLTSLLAVQYLHTRDRKSVDNTVCFNFFLMFIFNFCFCVHFSIAIYFLFLFNAGSTHWNSQGPVPHLGKTQQALSIRNTPVAFSTFTNLILSLHIWLVPYFNPACIPSPPLTIDLIVHALFLSPFHSSIGIFTCLYLCLLSCNPISFWFWWCLNSLLSQAHLCALTAGLVMGNMQQTEKQQAEEVMDISQRLEPT